MSMRLEQKQEKEHEKEFAKTIDDKLQSMFEKKTFNRLMSALMSSKGLK